MQLEGGKTLTLEPKPLFHFARFLLGLFPQVVLDFNFQPRQTNWKREIRRVHSKSKTPHTVSSSWCHREAELLYSANLSSLSPEPAEYNACVLRQEDSFPCKCGLLIPAGIDFLGPGRRKD